MLKNLSWQLVFLPLMLLVGGKALAQKSKNMPFYDDKKVRYGFQIGLYQARLNLTNSTYFANGDDSTQWIQPIDKFGFSLGFILNIKLKDELWAVRILPNVSFYEREITFGYANSTHTELFESTFIELPILLKYKSVRRNNHRMYMIGGLMAGLEVGNKRESLAENSLVTEKFALEVQYGFGFDLYFEMFKFAPEIRFSHGLTNSLVQNGNIYARNLDRISTHKITVFLNFE